MIPDKVVDKLIKAQRLAKHGVAGERKAAAQAIQNTLDKYGITWDDIDRLERTLHRFSYRTKMQRETLERVASRVVGYHNLGRFVAPIR
jgi:hypothetical protein